MVTKTNAGGILPYKEVAFPPKSVGIDPAGNLPDDQVPKQLPMSDKIKPEAIKKEVERLYSISYTLPKVGGKSDGKVVTDFPLDKVYQGALAEREHTDDISMMVKTACDHLIEDKNYYEKLKTIEKGDDKQPDIAPVGGFKGNPANPQGNPFDGSNVKPSDVRLSAFEDEDEEDIEQELMLQVFASPGGKNKVAKKIVRWIPAHKTYTECFAGGAAVYFNKEPCALEVLNDKDPDIAFAYNFVKNIDAQKIASLQAMNWISNEGTFHKLKSTTETKSDMERFYKYMYLIKTSFGANRSSYGHKENVQFGVLKRMDKLAERMKNTRVHNLDYAEILKRYDSPDTFHFIDPPYPGEWPGPEGISLWGEKQVGELVSLLGTMKGKWLVTLNDVPWIRKMFMEKGWQVMKTLVPRSFRTGMKPKFELFVLNYEVKDKDLLPNSSSEMQEQVHNDSLKEIIELYSRDKTIEGKHYQVDSAVMVLSELYKIGNVSQQLLLNPTSKELIDEAHKKMRELSPTPKEVVELCDIIVKPDMVIGFADVDGSLNIQMRELIPSDFEYAKQNILAQNKERIVLNSNLTDYSKTFGLYDLVLVKRKSPVDEENTFFRPMKPMVEAQTYDDVIKLADEQKGSFVLDKSYEGPHVMVHKKGNVVKVFSDYGKDITNYFDSEIINSLKQDGRDLIVDCSIVYFDGKKIAENDKVIKLLSDESVKKGEGVQVVFYANDLVHCDKDISKLELVERKKYLKSIPYNSTFKISPYVIVNSHEEIKRGTVLFSKLFGSNGVLLKEVHSTYSPSDKEVNWIKYRRC